MENPVYNEDTEDDIVVHVCPGCDESRRHAALELAVEACNTAVIPADGDVIVRVASAFERFLKGEDPAKLQ